MNLKMTCFPYFRITLHIKVFRQTTESFFERMAVCYIEICEIKTVLGSHLL